tara:strand:- start:404 stop:1072 length:669 start_codon:yes stop_codon:yes gene_type:complete
MALPTSGNLTLNQIHVEAGGSSGTACTLNDTDIRGLNAASGYTIPTSSGSAIEIGDFYGATQALSFVINNGQSSYIGGGASQYGVNGWAIPGYYGKITTNVGSVNSGSTSNSSFFGGNAVASAFATHHNLTGNIVINLYVYGSHNNVDSVFSGFAISNSVASSPTYTRANAASYTTNFNNSSNGQASTRWTWHSSFGGGVQSNFPPFWAGSYSTRTLTFFKT